MLYTYSQDNQTVNANNDVVLNTNGVRSSCGISHTAGSSTISITRPGVYIIDVTLDATSATAGTSQFSLYNNGTAIKGALATNTIATANDVGNYNFTTAIRVLPSCYAVNNNAQLTLVNTGANTAIVSNAAVVIRAV